MSATWGVGSGSCITIVLVRLAAVPASDLGLQLLGKIHPCLELEQTSFKSDKYTNVPGVRVLEFDQILMQRERGPFISISNELLYIMT